MTPPQEGGVLGFSPEMKSRQGSPVAEPKSALDTFSCLAAMGNGELGGRQGEATRKAADCSGLPCVLCQKMEKPSCTRAGWEWTFVKDAIIAEKWTWVS